MKIHKIIIISYFILAIVITWFIYDWINPNYEKCFRQNSKEFAENRIHFEELIKNIKSHNWKVEKNPNLTEISKIVSEKYQMQLDEIGMENVEINFVEDLHCSDKLTFTFNVNSGYNIRTLRVVQII